MLTIKGETEAKIMGTIMVMLETGLDEKTIAEELGINRIEVAHKIAKIACIIDTYINDADSEWD